MLAMGEGVTIGDGVGVDDGEGVGEGGGEGDGESEGDGEGAGHGFISPVFVASLVADENRTHGSCPSRSRPIDSPLPGAQIASSYP